MSTQPEAHMFFRDYHTILDNWDEPPSYAERGKASTQEPLARAKENSPRQVIFEMGLVVLVPLILAAAVGLLLNSTAFFGL